MTITSYAESTVHAGLSGNGNFAIGARTIAARILLTTVPGYVGFVPADPQIFFDAGFFTTSTNEGNYATERIAKSPQVVQIPALANTIHYTLTTGVVATITELVRGP